MSSAAHVVLFAFPFGTHAAPLLALARALAAAEPSADFTFFNTAESIARLPRAPPISNLQICHVDGGNEEGIPERNIQARIGAFMEATPGNFRTGLERELMKGGEKVSAVMSDAFLWTAGEVAEELGVPWVPVWTGGPKGLVAHLYTDELRRQFRHMDDKAILAGEDHPIHFIPALSSLRLRDLPEDVLLTDINSPMAFLLHRMGNTLPSAAAVAVNTFQDLVPITDATLSTNLKKFLPVGPFNLLSPSPPTVEKEANKCLSWLNAQSNASVVYVSFGTVMMLPPSELAELAAGLEASGAPFVWSLVERARDALPVGFLERMGERGHVVSWVPQVAVLEHAAVGAFLMHCGWNSVLESVGCGVPMVCRPHFGDQRSNAEVVSRVWRVGVSLEGDAATRERVAEALNVVLREEEGKEMKRRVCELRELAVRAVEEGGSSRENVKSLLDVVCGRC